MPEYNKDFRDRIQGCKAILFDWDGTLINSVPLKIDNASMVFHERYFCDPESVKAAYRKHSGKPRRQLFSDILREVASQDLTDSLYEDLNRGFSEKNLKSIKETPLFPDVREALTRLRTTGLVLSISSSVPPEELRSMVKHVGLESSFDEILGSHEEFTKGLAHVSILCGKLGITPAEICMVGDDRADILLARQAGVISIGRIGTLARQELYALEPDWIVADLMELADCF